MVYIVTIKFDAYCGTQRTCSLPLSVWKNALPNNDPLVKERRSSFRFITDSTKCTIHLPILTEIYKLFRFVSINIH